MDENVVLAPKCYFAIGGGSDFFSACLLSRSEEDFILTALGPVYRDGAIDLSRTMEKYLSREYPFQTWERGTWPILVDSRRPHAFGVIVPNKTDPLFEECCVIVKNLIGNREIEAVDTGGDSLRGILPGFGDVDVSYLFNGIRDTRDEDCILLIRSITRKPVRIVVLAPGADGETSQQGLSEGIHALTDACDAKNITLISTGHISTLLLLSESKLGWEAPSPGSTIDNITRALTLDGTKSRISIIRRGHVLHEVPVDYLTSFFILDIHSMK